MLVTKHSDTGLDFNLTSAKCYKVRWDPFYTFQCTHRFLREVAVVSKLVRGFIFGN